jgi:hypothetical protein
MIVHRQNRSWIESLTDEKVLRNTFDFYYLLETNDHPILEKIKELTLCNYRVVARFDYLGYNGQYLYCNGQLLVWRNRKTAPMQYGSNVKLIEGKPLRMSGSNQYPTVRFEENYCVLEFISDGLPIINDLHGWKITIISMDKI